MRRDGALLPAGAPASPHAEEDGLISARFVRAHVALVAFVTVVTAWFSYAYFNVDEYFQVIEFARLKLDPDAVHDLPWEHAARLRPWFQPFVYWLVGRVLGAVGVRDIFALAFVFRLLTAAANLGALVLFLRTTLPWLKTEEEQRLHVRVATLAGFLPYLFVRASSEGGSMAAITAAWALLLEGATPSIPPARPRWTVPALARPRRLLLVGLLFGLAFEMRFQTAFVTFGVLAWLLFATRGAKGALPWIVPGGLAAVALGLVLDRWGYGVWTFPPWRYFHANLVEGVALQYGADPPFAYFWMLPANVFLPVVVVLLVLALAAWIRCPSHPITWATVPFFVAHNLIAHKEERFLFPIAVLATSFVTMALAPSAGTRLARFAAWGWGRCTRWPGKSIVVFSTAMMVLLAFYPLGWHHHVRFVRALRDHFGEEVHALALPEVEQTVPPFHPRTWDVARATPAEVAARVRETRSPQWLIADRPVLRTGEPALDDHAVLVYSELPTYRHPELHARALRWVARYNAWAPPPLRQLKFRTLYRIDP